MERITEKMLKAQVDCLNKMKGFENPPYSTIGSYCLSFAYGGVSLHQYTTTGGGIREIFPCGHTTKKDLFNRIDAYIKGGEWLGMLNFLDKVAKVVAVMIVSLVTSLLLFIGALIW